MGSIPTAALAPSSPSNGQLWFNTVTERVNVYFSGIWMTIATITDAEVLQDHIHDTSIDGNGMIATVFVNAGELGSPQSLSVDAGNSSTTDWEETYNGGVVTDNFN